jgi:hypothetical protein
VRRTVVLVAAAAALLALAALAAGCGGSSQPAAAASPQWKQVLTTDVSGAKPVKLNLGTHELGAGARLSWVLSGPTKAPPVVLTFRIINQKNGVGYGSSVSPTDPGFSLDDQDAFLLVPIWKGPYYVFFSQRFPQVKGPGYDVKLTVWSLK